MKKLIREYKTKCTITDMKLWVESTKTLLIYASSELISNELLIVPTTIYYEETL